MNSIDKIVNIMEGYGSITCDLFDNQDISHLVKLNYDALKILFFLKQNYSIHIEIYDHFETTIYLSEAAWYTELYNILNLPSVQTDLDGLIKII